MTDEDEQIERRRKLLEEIAEEARITEGFTGRAAFAPRVMRALSEVPRHEFVVAEQAWLAYINKPLPIGHGQTISQPYIVALMTDLLEPAGDDVVLEIGTGSGYQAAVLARLVRHVYSIEVVDSLANEASERLARLGYDNVTVRSGDGYAGWPEHAPFDSVIVTAAAPEIPPPLIEQLKPGGRMVIPVGDPWMGQDLILIEKGADRGIRQRNVLPVAFVPLTGEH